MRGVSVAVLLAAVALGQVPDSRPFRLEELRTPPGFEVSVFAVLAGPRLMTFGPNGVLYVAVRGAGSVVAIPEASRVVTVLSGLNSPHSVVFQGNDLYVAADDGVLRYRNALTSDFIVRGQAERIVQLPEGGGHNTRTARFGPDGALYATAGSTCNFCIETDPRRAAMMRYSNDFGQETIYARGLRNSVDFAWHPLTRELWATDNGGDGLGDDEPPDEINVIRAGGDYGWPDCVADRRPVNWGPEARPQRCPDTLGPEQPLQAHSAPLGMSFYTGQQFPASWSNDLLVGFHGSWNRSVPTGYKVVRVHASSGRAAGMEDFLWGFLDVEKRTQSGRPVHPLAGPDGAVYVSDDQTGNIYRVIYTGPRINPGGIVPVVGQIYALYGENLVNDPAAFQILANGVPCDTLYRGRWQVNFLVPDGVSRPITIIVKNEKASDQAVLQ